MRRVWVLLAVVGLLGGSSAFGQAGGAKDDPQQAFDSAKAAAEGLFQACKDNDTTALVRMFGARYAEALKKLDVEEEKQHRHHLWQQSQEFTKLLEKAPDRVEIVVGKTPWAFPVPITKGSRGWVFNTDEGFKELLARRIGENELNAIDVCRTFPIAQLEYAVADRDGDEVREYAQRFGSSSGKRDGLYWETKADSAESLSPLGEFLARAEVGAGGSPSAGAPYMGYYFKILTRQGSNPPGGKYDYVINGNMIAGFALLAWPAEYRSSGVKTFLISHQGTLYEQDLGPDTTKLAQEITEYNPDKTWSVVRAGQ
jgi:hypothetical protein